MIWGIGGSDGGHEFCYNLCRSARFRSVAAVVALVSHERDERV
jgi:hypothetical protein